MHLDFDHLGSLFFAYGFDFVGAVLIAVVGWWLAGMIERGTQRVLMSSPHMDLTVGTFLSSLARYATLVIVFVIILQVVGVQATSLVAIIGAASLAIGLALQGTLSQMAAGVMLLIFRPFRIGDSIEVAGKSGTVKNLNLFMTELASADNIQVLIPNGQVWGAAMSNFSVYGTRRISLSVPVMLDKDVGAIASHLRTYLKEDMRVLDHPLPTVTASNLTDKGVEFSIQAWAKTEDADAVRNDFVRTLAAVQAPTAPYQAH
ncbi:MAG: mechanosensitive ion channel [Bradyrhizobium sp.]|nr:mechanosensitive ion channel [Bradyrhizobium sp.]